METGTKFKLAMVLGIVILVVDILWIYSSVPHFGGAGGLPYRNYTGSNSTAPAFNSSRAAAFRSSGIGFGYGGVLFGVIILIADVIWMYLEFSSQKSPAKKAH